jgi:hypothetical protein
MTMKYEWTLLFRRDGKDYVHERFSTFDPNEARRNHEHSCEFLWVTGDMTEPMVSELEAVDERGRVRIRESCRPGQDPRRTYRPVPPPDGITIP